VDEVLVVDDGSSDATASVAEAFGGPVTCLRTANRGVAAARNTGIAEARGEFVAFLDADDLWEPSKLALQLQRVDAAPEAAASTTGRQRVDRELRALDEMRLEQPEDPCEALLLRSMVLGPCSSLLVRRDLLREIGGFDTRFSQCADWDLFLRLALRTRFASVGDALVRYRTTPDNMSSDIRLLERDTFAVLSSFYSAGPPARYVRLKRRAYGNHWLILSGSYLQAGDRRAALRCLARGIRLSPGNVSKALGLPVRRLRRSVA
jgi:glycosyltransferase involved in cell wall biosynthesis